MINFIHHEETKIFRNLDAPLTMPNNHFTDLLMPFLGKLVELPQKRS